MIGEYTIMDWVTLLAIIASIATTIISIVGAVIKNSRDTNAILREFKAQSTEHEGIKSELNRIPQTVFGERQELSKEHQDIKKDTAYVRDELLAEKMARQNLYHNTSRAKEILDTMDMMKEVIHQNSQLTIENTALKTEKKALTKTQKQTEELMALIYQFDRRLSNVEEYSETEEIRSLLRRILNELEEQV